ncbi:MAG: glycosyltransferase family 4 protein [Candidatus Peregrinibacteria bacterium]
MKLLIVTQKADSSDPILGFFHQWITAFASRIEHLTIIAQYAGKVSLPENVTVKSLGKEHGAPIWRQILRFWWIAWRERFQYDRVLVHMTPVWVILGWPMWFLLRKRVFLWYEIRRGSWRLNLALLFVRKVFSATVQGLPRPHRKQIVTGHGIDVDIFSPDPACHETGLIVAVGRITRSKRYDVLLRAFVLLPQHCRLQIAGGMVTQADEEEWDALQSLMQKLNISGRVAVQWVEPAQMPDLLRRAELMLHACVGGLDKAVLEAMACGCPVVSSSVAAQDVLPQLCRATPESIGEVAQKILSLSSTERIALSEESRRRVLEGHSLPKLIERLVKEMA